MANRDHHPRTIYRRLVRQLNRRGYCILEKRLRNYHAHAQNRIIVINSAKDAVVWLRCLIHEGLHDIYPDWPETEINQAEVLVLHSLNVSQLQKLALLYQRLVRRGKQRKNT